MFWSTRYLSSFQARGKEEPFEKWFIIKKNEEEITKLEHCGKRAKNFTGCDHL